MTDKTVLNTLLESPVAVFVVTYLVYGLSIYALLQVTETLLFPAIFSAFMLPALVSTAYHLKAPIMRVEHYIHDHWLHGHSH